MPASFFLLRRRPWFSLALTFTAALPLALLLSGPVRRSVHLARLDGAPDQRERALGYVVRSVRSDPALASAVIDRFNTLQPDALLQTYSALAHSAGRPTAGSSARLIHNLHRFDHAGFIRAFDLLQTSGAGHHPALLLQAARRVGSASPAGAEALRERLARRGAWATPPVPTPVYLEWIAQRCAQASPMLRRHAAGLLAALPTAVFATPAHAQRIGQLLGGLSDDPQPAVRRAALVAAAALHATDPHAVKLVRRLQADADPGVRGAAADVMDLLDQHLPLRPAVPRPPSQTTTTPDGRLAAWRDLVLVPDGRTLRAHLEQVAAGPVGDAHPDTPLVYAAAARRGVVDPDLLRRAGAQGLPPAEWRRLLAQFEGAPTASVTLDLPEATPHLLRPAAVRAARRPRPAWLAPLLRARDRPALRAHACLMAAERFDEYALTLLIDELLAAAHPEARISGALIAGLCQHRPHVLRRLGEHDPHRGVRRFARLARWMHDAPFQHDAPAPEALEGSALPEPLVMLALLHRGAWGPVLDRLLDPEAYPPPRLRALLGRERFARVLAHYLPPDAPRLHLWADGDWFARELDVLAAWAAVHRRRGRIPGVSDIMQTLFP